MTFEQWFLDNVGIPLEQAKRSEVLDLYLLEKAFNDGIREGEKK